MSDIGSLRDLVPVLSKLEGGAGERSGVADLQYEDLQLAELYDPFNADRSDLEVYASLLDELGGHSVVDVGCGTGTLCCLLAERGKQVTGVDPADAEMRVARRKVGADRVRSLHGDGASVPASKGHGRPSSGHAVTAVAEPW
jgi:SAM-dependent methyltransferase